MTSVRRNTSRYRRWRAWAGTSDELAVIARIASDLNGRRPRSSRPDEIERRWRVDAIAEHGSDSVAGPFDTIKAEIDRRTLTKLSIRITGDYVSPLDPLQLTFNQGWSEPFQPAVTLRIENEDRGWVNQALTSLSEEIDKGVPRWNFVYFPGIRLLTLILCGVAAAFTSTNIYRLFLPDPLWSNVGYATGALAGIAVMLSWRWLFPTIEILVPGSPSTGSRRLAALGALIVTIIAGVFINTIS